ncbi:MAG: hypothetical protein HC811_04735 [Flammeovirgaceae bacterium]|nr:hypothetical protein [Flammeovirgaceae bacterium]
MTVLLISIGFVALFFVLMSVRLLLVKDGEFRGTCASQSPFLLKDGVTCGYCGRNLGAGEVCASNEPMPNGTNFPDIHKK